MMASALPEPLLREIERTAVELAQRGGNEIKAALGRLVRVQYKGVDEDPANFRDPVSDVDARVEELIRGRLSDRFPDHDIIGEEVDHRPGRGHDFVWAVDPIDGTANFINGFPLFASSVGVLFQGEPIVGAVWCSTSHALQPGVYHAAVGGSLRFDGIALEGRPNPAVQRRLGGEPFAQKSRSHGWDGRKTGSAAIECAFVAAGILEMAWFERPNIWDVAGGFALNRAIGNEILHREAGEWTGFTGFAAGDEDPGAWSAATALGSAPALERFRNADSVPH